MVDRNWQFSLHFLLLLWQIVGATTIAPTLGAILSLWFVTVFAKSIHIPRLLYTHKIFVCCQFMPESSIHPEQYRVLPLLNQSWSLFPVGGKMPFFTRKFGTGYSHPAVLCGCFLLSSSLAIWCSYVIYFWPCTLIRSLWPKQGTDLLILQHGSISVFGGEQSWLWDMGFGSSEALGSDFTQNLYWEQCRSWSYKI